MVYLTFYDAHINVQVILFIYTLQRFSVLNSYINDTVMFVIMITMYGFYTFFNTKMMILNLVICVMMYKSIKGIKANVFCILTTFGQTVLLNVLPVVLGKMLFFEHIQDSVDEPTERQYCAVLLFASGNILVYIQQDPLTLSGPMSLSLSLSLSLKWG